MKKCGKILKVRLGVNPNSSSLGTGVLFLMLGTPILTIMVFVLSTIARTSRRREPDAEGNPHPPV